MCVTLENESLKILVDPDHGGRVTSFFDKRFQREYLWYDASRLPVDPALDYDGNFAGGMDELLPCDSPERGFPDHGELWTLPLNVTREENKVSLTGRLPLSSLAYTREMKLLDNSLISHCRIINRGSRPLDFLWKLHAALAIEPGDCLIVPAHCQQAADPGNWSRLADGMPVRCPGRYVMPEMDGKSDFFYLTDWEKGEMMLEKRNGGIFCVSFDLNVFPCAWVFASFGRLNQSRTLIMEPCTNYPLFLDEAARCRCCAHLEAEASLETSICWSIK